MASRRRKKQKPPAGDVVSYDQYGGIAEISLGATGYFRLALARGRWVLVTPDGHPFWMRGVYHMDDSTHDIGGGVTYHDIVNTKYGDVDLTWAPQQNRRMKSWGFNALGEYANNWALPWATIVDPKWPGDVQPVKMPAVPFPMQGAFYSLTNVDSLATNPVKELYWSPDSHYTGYRGRFPDVYDPSFAEWVAGRAAQFSGLVASPWLIGISTDDTDFITGIGPGPDFDTGGNAHPHLGYLVLLCPPTQTVNYNTTITYTDTTVYSKNALRDMLIAKYGTVGALNTAWGSTYTTFHSDGGWPSGAGFLDENGKGAWTGTNPITLNGAAAVNADLDDVLYAIAAKYFTVYKTAIRALYPTVLMLGPTTVGGWGAPARRQVVKAAGENLDVIRTMTSGVQARVDFVAQHGGNIPLVYWHGGTANPDSPYSATSPPGDSSQEARGATYAAQISSFVAMVAQPTGTIPCVGIQWWEYKDSWPEQQNFGLITLRDNGYDGVQDKIATGTDAWGYSTGGEVANYGNFLGQVIQSNAAIDAALATALSPTGRIHIPI